MSTTAPDAGRHRADPLPGTSAGLKEIPRRPTRSPTSDRLDTLGGWLVITWAAVFPMTICPGRIGGLLAAAAARASGLTVDYALLDDLRGRACPGARRHNNINDY